MTERISDATLDARLEAHFEALASAHPVPDFEAQMALAAERLQPRHRTRVGAYGAAAAVAAFAVGAVLVAALYKKPVVLDAADTLDAADRRLVTELTASTTWHAPSDGWLATKGLEILSMPEFDDMTYGNDLNGSAAGGF